MHKVRALRVVALDLMLAQGRWHNSLSHALAVGGSKYRGFRMYDAFDVDAHCEIMYYDRRFETNG